MDIYLSSLVLGGVGLGAMALGGHFGHHDHGNGHGHDHVHVHEPVHVHDATGHGHAHGHGDAHAPAHAPATSHGPDYLSILAWPRLAFGFALGLGAVGIAIKSFTYEPVTLILAAVGGFLFQRYLVQQIWNLTFRFESTPATTSEGADEATAVTSFNQNGEGLVAIEVDGQIVQVLGRLKPADRELGVVVRAGQKLRVEDVNTANNRCTVSAL